MFTSQAVGGLSKKRGRDDDGDGDVAIGGTEGFTEHRNKRLQSLPFRTSPASKRLSFPPSFNNAALSSHSPPNAHHAPHNMTPTDSDSEEAHRAFHQTTLANPSLPNPSLAMPRLVDDAFGHAPEMVDDYRTHDVDMDMDMDGSDHSQAHNSHHLDAGSSQPDPVQPGGIASRMPTPIHCSFAAQVRGNNWGGAAGNVLQHNGNGFGPPPDRSIPRSLDHNAMTDWNLMRDRRLPSPISESGGEDFGSPRMVLDTQLRQGMPPRAASAMDFSPARTQTAFSNLSDSVGELNNLASSNPCHAASNTTDCGVSNANAMDIEHATPSPKKGHTRSRHTLNSWTQNVPGMKKTFSIGYRADCEKCRQKVPGHFNHIIVS